MLKFSQGWENSAADDIFRRRRETADQANDRVKSSFFSMMIKIAEQIHGPAHYLQTPPNARILDLCAAPGWFLKFFLRSRRQVTADAISLPVKKGGHQMLIELKAKNGSLNLHYADVTMFASEIGCTDVPRGHAEYDQLQQVWPFQGEYDLILCDGQNLRGHALPEYRQGFEQGRLATAQLAIALNRVREGGTIVMLMHRIGKWITFSTICKLAAFSELTLVKPKPFHAIKSSFYMIAQHVKRNAQHQATLEEYQKIWKVNTIGMSPEDDPSRRSEPASKAAFDGFIDEYKCLAREVINMQVEALERVSWTKGTQNGDL